MRFHLGAIPDSPGFEPDSSWRALVEPTPWRMQLYALPIALGTGIVFAVLWFVLTPLSARAGVDVSIYGFLLAFAGIVVVHELIHAATHPGAGRSRESILGFWPKTLLFYAAYTGELSRNRFIAIALMPLLVISVVPLVVAAVTRTASGWVAFVSTLNAIMACGDLFAAGLLLVRLPPTAIVRNQGWRTFWREEGIDTP